MARASLRPLKVIMAECLVSKRHEAERKDGVMQLCGGRGSLPSQAGSEADSMFESKKPVGVSKSGSVTMGVDHLPPSHFMADELAALDSSTDSIVGRDREEETPLQLDQRAHQQQGH